MVFHWSLSDSKSPQVSRTRLRILAVLSNAVVWIVSVHPSISKSSRPFNNPLFIVPNAPITIGTIVTLLLLLFYSLLVFHSKSLQVSWTLLIIVAHLNIAVVCWISTFLIFISFCPFFPKSFGIIPSAPTTIGIIVTLLFHSCFFFQSSRHVQEFVLFKKFFF